MEIQIGIDGENDNGTDGMDGREYKKEKGMCSREGDDYYDFMQIKHWVRNGSACVEHMGDPGNGVDSVFCG